MSERPSAPILPTLVRPVRPDDADALLDTCWPDRSLVGVREFLQRARRLVADQRGLAVVALRENRVCGFGMLTLWPRVAEISDLVVAPCYRSQGVGTTIISHLTDTARGLNATIVEIGVALWNVRALRLYRRLGFGEERTVYLDLGTGPEIVLFLKKYLASPRPG